MTVQTTIWKGGGERETGIDYIFMFQNKTLSTLS